jgi:hypothetical protein
MKKNCGKWQDEKEKVKKPFDAYDNASRNLTRLAPSKKRKQYMEWGEIWLSRRHHKLWTLGGVGMSFTQMKTSSTETNESTKERPFKYTLMTNPIHARRHFPES